MGFEEWKEYRLGDFADVQNGYAFKASDFVNAGIPIIKIKNIASSQIKFEDVQYYNGKIAGKLEQFLIKKDDVLISMTGSNVNQMASAVGKVGKYQFDFPALLNQRVGKVYIKKSNIADHKFLYYFLNKFETQFELASSAGGSANQANISPTQIKNLSLILPPLNIQQRIASILSSLDDKIELNRQTNQTLEAIAQALFKEWFVDFNFPGATGEMQDSELGEIPRGWEIQKVSEVLEVKYGKDHKHLEPGNIPVYGSGGVMRFANRSLYENESILIPRKGTLSNLFYINKPFWSVDTMFYSKIKLANGGKYLFHLLLSLNLASMNVGSAVPSLTTEILNNILVTIPSEELLSKYENVVSSLFNQREQNIEMNSSLTELRDTLLPKLMKGEINISN